MIIITCNDCEMVDQVNEDYDPFHEYHCSNPDCNSLDVEVEELD